MNRISVLKNSTPGMQLLTLAVLWIMLLLFSLAFMRIIGKVLWQVDLLSITQSADVNNPEHLKYLRFSQVVSQIAILLLPPVVLAFLISEKPFSWLMINRRVSLASLITGSLLVVVALPVIDLLGQYNLSMKLPESMAATETWMREAEKNATALTEAFLGQSSPYHLFSNLFMVGLLAAIGEELLFRSALIRILSKLLKNSRIVVHLAVIISSFLFAGLHFQFFTFLPRFALGLLLGYAFVWSGSIWLPIIIHFANNALAILAYYAYNTGSSTYNPSELGAANGNYLYLLSFGGIAVMMFYLWYRGRVKNKSEWFALIDEREAHDPQAPDQHISL